MFSYLIIQSDSLSHLLVYLITISLEFINIQLISFYILFGVLF